MVKVRDGVPVNVLFVGPSIRDATLGTVLCTIGWFLKDTTPIRATLLEVGTVAGLQLPVLFQLLSDAPVQSIAFTKVMVLPFDDGPV